MLYAIGGGSLAVLGGAAWLLLGDDVRWRWRHRKYRRAGWIV